MRSRLLPAIAAALCSLSLAFAGIAAAAPATKPGHVFIIVLENEGFGYTFGAKSPATSPTDTSGCSRSPWGWR